jgi:hypothetical protein
MNVLAHAVPRGWRGRGLLAVAAVVAMAAGTLSVTAKANAQEGRRICEYSFKVKPKNTNPRNPAKEDPLLSVSLGVDYKKDGACPGLDPWKLEATGYVDVDQVNPKNPVNKWTCEDWGNTHQTIFTTFGYDPCFDMWDDYVYAFIWEDPTLPNAQKPRIERLGWKGDYY